MGRLEQALEALKEARTIVEARDVRAGIRAIDTWIKAKNFSAETVRKSAEVKLRTDYHFGRALQQLEKNKGGQPMQGRSTGRKHRRVEAPVAPTLEELGVDKDDASKCQQLTAVSESEFEEILRSAANAGEKLTISRAVRLVKKAKQPLCIEPPPLPAGTFNLIYADPPWQSDFRRGTARDVENHYPTMSTADIAAIDVPSLAAPDCVLFLWATSPMLFEARAVLSAWGFLYKSSAVWVKSGMAMGYYFRQDHELLLIATQGKPGAPAEENRVSSVVSAAKGRHSEKPAAFYEIIERMYPSAVRLELFARGAARPGWTFWGNEAE